MGPALIFIILTLLPSLASAQSLPKVRMAYTSINIQMTPIYMMKELDLPRKQGLDVEILYIPVSSRAVQAALAGEIHFLTSGGIANINANMAGADFVGITATLNTFAFKIIGQPGLREPKNLKGKKIGISRLGGASDFSARFALDRWGLVPDKDVAIVQIGGEPELMLALQKKAVDAGVAADPFGPMALREGFSLVFDLSQLGVPYTMHGIGTRKSIVREKRDIVIRFMKSYLEGIHLFKTNRELALNTLKKYARLEDLTIMQGLYD
jgi:NitT/TauT family transport system substrate-binding protein